MNTKTMRLPPRRISTTNASNNSNKRKEKESGLDALHQSTTTTKKLKLPPPQLGSPKPPVEPAYTGPSGRLMAGYLAHEFLTKGTLLGQPWDPARAESPPLLLSVAGGGGGCGGGDNNNNKGEAEPELRAKPKFESLERYVEVADLLKAEGAHMAGIVNPTQLARVLQL